MASSNALLGAAPQGVDNKCLWSVLGQRLSIEECAHWPQVGRCTPTSPSSPPLLPFFAFSFVSVFVPFVGFRLGVKRASCNMLRWLGWHWRQETAGRNSERGGWGRREVQLKCWPHKSRTTTTTITTRALATLTATMKYAKY